MLAGLNEFFFGEISRTDGLRIAIIAPLKCSRQQAANLLQPSRHGINFCIRLMPNQLAGLSFKVPYIILIQPVSLQIRLQKSRHNYRPE